MAATTVVLAASWSPVARAQARESWAVDWSGAFRGQLSTGEMADLVGNGVGLDLALRVTPPRSRLGLRVEGVMTAYAAKKMRNDVLSVGTGHNLAGLSAGPQWSVPAGEDRWELYAMAGAARVRPNSHGLALPSGNEVPPSSRTSIVSLGSAWILPLSFRDAVWIEFGAEITLGGEALFFDDPPIVLDASGEYVYRSKRARVSGFAIRVGFGKSFP